MVLGLGSGSGLVLGLGLGLVRVRVTVILSSICYWLIYVHCVPSILGKTYSRTGLICLRGALWRILLKHI